MSDRELSTGATERIRAAQQGLRENGLDGWLLYDFQGKNPIFWQLLGVPRHTTRRCYLLIPREGEARLLVHRIDASALAPFGIEAETYLTWQQLAERLPLFLGGSRRLAMDYAPGCILPVVSRADAGTVELVRSLGVEVVSSADLIQAAVARWSDRDLEDHRSAAAGLMASLDALWEHVRRAVDGGLTEHAAQQFLLRQFAERGLATEDPPVVAVNAHAGDPHYEPSAEDSTPIRRGDWLLVDLWARQDRPGTVYADSTWVACLGQPTAEQREVFDVVVRARDAAVARIRDGLRRGEPVQGWQVDRAARDLVEAAGYGEYFTHRTGHSLGQQVHGPGVNLDDFETHDTRSLIEGIAVTVEPGIYLPEFGVRSEIDVVITPDGPLVTLPEQRDVTLL
ncbi:MAG TPA: M24 family metallopeptidase [Chloroflexota bacterium]|jgi:Xaa-Pro aminopeptidase|nr:M24 family metallopeptidase [Chloroflexota bacterium]